MNITSQRAGNSSVDCNGVHLDRSRTTGSTGATISDQQKQKQRPVRHRSSVSDRQVQRPVSQRSTATNRSNDQRATGAAPANDRIDYLRPTAAASDSTGADSAINSDQKKRSVNDRTKQRQRSAARNSDQQVQRSASQRSTANKGV